MHLDYMFASIVYLNDDMASATHLVPLLGIKQIRSVALLVS